MFRSKPGRWRGVARIGTAAAMAQLITLLLLDSTTFWPILTVMILSSRNVGVTWKRAFQRVIGTAVGFFLAISLVAIFPQTPGGLLACFIPIFIVTLYLSQTIPANAYAFFMVIVTLTVIVEPAWANPDFVVDQGLDRFTETIIGILCISFVSRVVFPITAEKELEKEIRSSLNRSDERFNHCLAKLEGRELGGKPIIPESRTSYTEKVELLDAAIAESTRVQDKRGIWISRINLTNRVAVQSQLLFDQLSNDDMKRIPDGYTDRMIKSIRTIRSQWCSIGSCMLSDGIPKIDEHAMNEMADELERNRTHNKDARRINAVTTTIMMLRQLGEIDDIVMVHESLTKKSRISNFGLFVLIDRKIKNVHVPALHLAVKATLAAMIALALVATFRWTNAMTTMAVTTILVMQPTLGATWSRSLQRMIGAVMGGTIGIIGLTIISPNTNDITWQLIYIGAGLGFASWLMSGSWETSYVGLQTALAIGLVMGSAAPSADVIPGLQRVTGVFFGLLIALTVLRLLWPVWAGSQVCESMSRATRQMARYLEVGIKHPEQEGMERPSGGWGYFILSTISHGYKFREEARYERGLTRLNATPGLNMGTRLQELMPKIVLIVEARHLRNLREDVSLHPAMTALREGIENRLNLIANIVEGGDGHPEELRPLLNSAYEAIGPGSKLIVGTNPDVIREFLGYYEDMIPELDLLVDDARQTADIFSESKGISRLAMRT